MSIRKKRYQLDQNKFLTPDEEIQLIALLNRSSNRDRLLITLGLFTGGRATELLNLTFADLNAQHNEVFLTGLKGSLNRAIPIPAKLFNEINSLPHGQSSERIFDISYPRLVQIWNEYKPNDKTFHSLRHTFAIRLFGRTQNIKLVQVALGHTNIANTMIYANYHYSTEELRKYILIE